jgi:hypothetical protein
MGTELVPKTLESLCILMWLSAREKSLNFVAAKASRLIAVLFTNFLWNMTMQK